MMSFKPDEYGGNLIPEVDSVLKRLAPQPPAGFARRTAGRFAAARARRRLRQMISLSVAVVSCACLAFWMTVLNVVSLGDAVWDGFMAAAAIIRSLFTLWDHLPVYGVTFAMAAMFLTLLIGGIVAKLDGQMVSMK
jgi:hypothetical protein